jgi:hypothetical protein
MNTNAEYMYSNLKSLEEIKFDGIETSSVSSMKKMFLGDTGLT